MAQNCVCGTEQDPESPSQRLDASTESIVHLQAMSVPQNGLGHISEAVLSDPSIHFIKQVRVLSFHPLLPPRAPPVGSLVQCPLCAVCGPLLNTKAGLGKDVHLLVHGSEAAPVTDQYHLRRGGRR